MFKIGEFSKISRVPAKTLRYYDEIGLLSPADVDKFTGYRYYSVQQLPRLNRILALKDLGLSLAQIRELLDDEITPDVIRAMLERKQDEIQAEIDDMQTRMTRVEVRLRQMEQEGKLFKQDIVVQSLPPQRVLSYRGIIPTLPSVGELFMKVFSAIMMRGIQPLSPAFIIYRAEEFTPQNVEIELAIPVANTVHDAVPIDDVRELTVRQIEKVENAACTFHKGEYKYFNQTYTHIAQWIEANHYKVVGHPREIYLTDEGSAPDALTQIQFPIAKI